MNRNSIDRIEEEQKKLEKLEEKRKKIRSKIASLKAKEKEKAKKADTRRKILIGAFALYKNENDIENLLKDNYFKDFKEFLSRETDLQLFDLKKQ